MKIVFWGTPKYASENLLKITEAGFDVIAVVTQPDRKRGRGKELSPSPVKQVAIDLGIPVYTTKSISKDKYIKELLSNLNPDVYIVVAFGQILPKEILDQPKLGCWNSHASLLPLWRGAAPIQWSIIKNDARTGVCIMSMEEGLDTGPVIEQESTEINDIDNLMTLTNRLSQISSKLLIKSLENIKLTYGLNKDERLEELKAVKQSNLTGKPSYARQINKNDYLIDWNQKAINIFKLIQGLYPNAYTLHNGKRIKILEVCILHDHNIQLSKDLDNIIPGEIIKIDNNNGIYIMTNDNPILIKYAQLEGKSKTDAYTLSIQAKLEIKNSFGS